MVCVILLDTSGHILAVSGFQIILLGGVCVHNSCLLVLQFEADFDPTSPGPLGFSVLLRADGEFFNYINVLLFFLS